MKKLLIWAIINITIVGILAGGLFYYRRDAMTWADAAISYKEKVAEKAGEITKLQEDSQRRIEELKDDVVNRLASCETKGVKEPDAAIIFDTNNQASIGAWQYQIKTIQYFVKKFEGREITRVEAITIAIDHDAAHELTRKILFEVPNSAKDNWYNCDKKLGLSQEIEIIKKID